MRKQANVEAENVDTGVETPVSGGKEVTAVIDTPTKTTFRTGYAPVNDLQMYYEIHGPSDRLGGEGRVPLVLLHGSMGSLDMFRGLLPTLAQNRQVIMMDIQAHGRTADIDRPLRYEQLAEDTAALMRYLSIDLADFCGFSMGSATALHLAIRHPELARKLVLLGGASLNNAGIYPQVMAGLVTYFTPEAFAGSPIEAEYKRLAPNPDDFPKLVLKVQRLTREAGEIPAEAVRAIVAPTLILLGDSDILRPEAAVELFRLRGGGVPGDFAPSLPPAQLAVLPATTHLGLIGRTEWLCSMITTFLDAPMGEGDLHEPPSREEKRTVGALPSVRSAVSPKE